MPPNHAIYGCRYYGATVRIDSLPGDIDPFCFTRPWFRSLKKEHAEQWTSTGRLRINHIYDYHGEASIRTGINDPDENRARIHVNASTFDTESSRATFTRQILNIDTQTAVHDTLVQGRIVTPDKYVLSATMIPDTDFQNSLPSDNIIVIIKEPWILCEEISDYLFGRGMLRSILFTAAKCEYVKMPIETSDDMARFSPAFCKDVSYMNQKEVRAIWHPKTTPIHAEFVQIDPQRTGCEIASAQSLISPPIPKSIPSIVWDLAYPLSTIDLPHVHGWR